MRIGVCLGISAALVGCTLDVPDEVQRRSSALMNGEAALHPAVGRVFGAGGCTGTVIAPDAVLTAAHCLARPRTDPSIPWEEFIAFPVYFELGDPDTELGAVEHITYSVSIHPDYDTNADRDFYIADEIDGDIAVLHFESLVSNAFVPPATEPPRVGDEITLVGFGNDGPGGPGGLSKIGFAPVAEVTDLNIISYGPLSELRARDDVAAICAGDSGGPSFITGDAGEVLVGVHSTNGAYSSGECGNETWDIRVDRYQAWIDCAVRSHVGEDCSDDKMLGAGGGGGAGSDATAAGCSIAPGNHGHSELFFLGLAVITIARRRRRRRSAKYP